MAAEPTEKDRAFISSFVDYAYYLAAETRREIDGEDSLIEELKVAGKKLIENAKVVGLAEDAEKLVWTAEDVVNHWALAPDVDEVIGTKSGNSVYEVMSALAKFENYFETKGMHLCVNNAVMDGVVICDTILGKMEKIPMPADMQLNLYTELMISTQDEIAKYVEQERVGMVGVTGGWVHDNNIYALLENRLLTCESILDELKESKRPDAFFKIKRLAWQSLLEKLGGDEQVFRKKYLTDSMNNVFIHEFYHKEMGKHSKNDDANDAAAVLYATSRGTITFDSLSSLYDPTSFYSYGPESAKLALKYLGDEGYDESLWTDLKPGSPEAEKAALKIKEMADVALEKLEKDYGMPSHTEMEQKLNINFDEVYQKIAETVERVAK